MLNRTKSSPVGDLRVVPHRVERTVELSSFLPPSSRLARVAAVPERPIAVVTVRGEDSDIVLRVDFESASPNILTWHCGANPDRVVASADGESVFVTERGAMSVATFQIETGTRDGRLIGSHAHGLAASEKLLAVGTLDSRILVFELPGFSELSQARYPDPEAALADLVLLTARGPIVAADFAQSALLVINPLNPDSPKRVATPVAPTCLAFDPILKRIYASAPDAKELMVVNMKDLMGDVSSIDRYPIPSGGTPVGLAVSPNAERVFVCVQHPDSMCIFHVDSRDWYPSLQTGVAPLGVAATVDSKHVIVTNQQSLSIVAVRYGFGTHPSDEGAISPESPSGFSGSAR